MQQIFTDSEVKFGEVRAVDWNWGGDGEKVPQNKVLDVFTMTLNYCPEGTGTLGRIDIAGRDSGNSAVWRVQIVYVEPKKTRHLTFPKGLRLEEDGYVELDFTSEGPGKIHVGLNGFL